MKATTSDSHSLAARALTLLDSGSLTELRALLATVAGDDGNDNSWPGEELRLAAACCAIGSPSPAVWWNPARLGRQGEAASRAIGGYVALQTAVHLSGEPLGDVRNWILDNTERLISAQTCMIDPPFPSGSIEAPDVWSAEMDKPAGRRSDNWPAETKANWIRNLLATQSAVRRTNERVTLRVIYWAREASLTQREIADSLQKPQTYVFRQLQQIDADPRAIAMTPRELHDHYRAGNIDRAQLLALLAAYRYERGTYPDESPDWAYVPGSYDELVQLAAEGSLSDEELDVVLAGIDAVATHHG